ncbi:MAG: hypoxanthine/guanine phosphoribosyltransferase [Methanosarcinaceae archaeon]
MLDILVESLKNAPIVDRGEYSYFIHPITDGVPSLDPRLIDEVVDHMIDIADMNVDKILSIEAMGIPLATALSLKSGIPFTIVRKRQYGLEGEVKLSQSTGYSKGELYINGIDRGDRLLIVDDVISTGGTLKVLIKALQDMGANISDVIVVISRGKGASKLRETGLNVTTLVDIDVNSEGVIIKEVAGEQ